jgi:hypothetical protein
MDTGQGGKGEVILWDPATGHAALSLPENAAGAFRVAGARLAAASADRHRTSSVRLFDTVGRPSADSTSPSSKKTEKPLGNSARVFALNHGRGAGGPGQRHRPIGPRKP